LATEGSDYSSEPEMRWAEGQGEIAMRLRERIHAVRHRRRRLPLRDRLRRRRRLVAIALKAEEMIAASSSTPGIDPEFSRSDD
jgi:hypothetical protein